MGGSENALQGFVSWKPSTPSRAKATELRGPPIHQISSDTSLIFTSCAVSLPAPPAPSADADVEAVGIQCLADPGSHAPQQGVEAADFEFPACGQACPSTVHAAMNGCPGASPAHGRSVSILRRLLSRRAESQRWRHLDSAFTSRAREKAQRSRQTPEAQGQSKGHSSLEDTQAAWGFRALLT